MNFIKGRDELKKFGACLFWFFITFVFGAFISYVYLKYKIKFDDPQCLRVALAAGVCFYIFTIIFNCSIKRIKAGIFESVSSKIDNSPDKTYKVFYYGIEPYVKNKLGIALKLNNSYDKNINEINSFNWLSAIHNSKEYHLCELKVYETIVNRRFWNIFCPFIETEILTMEEIDDIINHSVI